MNNGITTHPCLCDICLSARDAELKTAREGVVEEIQDYYMKQHGDKLKAWNIVLPDLLSTLKGNHA